MKASSFTYNARQGRFEVRFPGKPEAATRHGLKDRGFWWDGTTCCWHLARPVSVRFVRNEPISTDGFEYALDYCQTYLGMTQDQAAAIRKERNFAAQQAGERGMEEALGIA